MKIKRLSRVQVGDLAGFRLEGESSTGGGTIGGTMTFVAHQGMVYHIDVMSRASHVQKYAGRGHVVVRSFRPLTEEERDSFEIMRLKVFAARSGETLPAFSARIGNKLDIGTLAVLNDIFIDRRLEAGRLLKAGISEPYVPDRPGPPPQKTIEKEPGSEESAEPAPGFRSDSL